MKTTLLLVLLAAAGLAAAAPPPVDDFCSPSATDGVAVLEGQTVTDLDLYVFQAMRGEDPRLACDWRDAARRGDRQRLGRVEAAARELVRTRLAAGQAAAANTDPAVAAEARVLLARVAEIVFAERLVLPSIRIAPEDVAFFYRKNLEDYVVPEQVAIRRLRVPLEGPASERSFREARQRASVLREEAVRAGGLFPLLRDNPQYRLDEQPNATVTIRRGAGDAYPLVEAEANTLAISQVSHPLQIPGAVLLIEVVDRQPRRVKTLEEARPEIERRLRNDLLDLAFEQFLAEEMDLARPVSRARFYPHAEDDFEILRVRDFRLRKAHFASFEPRFRGPVETATPELLEALEAILQGEVVCQTVERTGFASDPRFVAARRVAAEMAAARAELERARADAIPTDAEVEAWLAANREALAPGRLYEIWRLAILAPPASDPGESLDERMADLQRIVSDAERQLAERADIAGPYAFKDPTRVVERLATGRKGSAWQLEPVGELGAVQARTELDIDPAAIAPGRFSPPGPQADGSAAALYVAGEREAEPPPAEALVARARQALLDERVRKPLLDAIAEREADGRLKWEIPTTGE